MRERGQNILNGTLIGSFNINHCEGSGYIQYRLKTLAFLTIKMAKRHWK